MCSRISRGNSELLHHLDTKATYLWRVCFRAMVMKSTDTAVVRHIVRGAFFVNFLCARAVYLIPITITIRMNNLSWNETQAKTTLRDTNWSDTRKKKRRQSENSLFLLGQIGCKSILPCARAEYNQRHGNLLANPTKTPQINVDYKVAGEFLPPSRRSRIYYKINVNKFIFFLVYGRKAVRVQDIGFAFARNGTHECGSKVFISCSHCWHMAFLAHWRPPNYRMKKVTWYICALTSPDPILLRVRCIRKIFALYTIRISENAYRYILTWWKTNFREFEHMKLKQYHLPVAPYPWLASYQSLTSLHAFLLRHFQRWISIVFVFAYTRVAFIRRVCFYFRLNRFQYQRNRMTSTERVKQTIAVHSASVHWAKYEHKRRNSSICSQCPEWIEFRVNPQWPNKHQPQP